MPTRLDETEQYCFFVRGYVVFPDEDIGVMTLFIRDFMRPWYAMTFVPVVRQEYFYAYSIGAYIRNERKSRPADLAYSPVTGDVTEITYLDDDTPFELDEDQEASLQPGEYEVKPLPALDRRPMIPRKRKREQDPEEEDEYNKRRRLN